MTDENTPEASHPDVAREIAEVKRLIDWAHSGLHRPEGDSAICPMVTGLMVCTKPGSPYYNKGFKETTESYLQSIGAKNVSIDDQQYHDRVTDLCRGIAFVYDKYKDELGHDCLNKLQEYYLCHQVQFEAKRPPSDFFYAVVRPTESQDGNLGMTIQAGIFALHAQKNCRLRDRVFRDDKIDGKFNASEMLTLIGVEEAMHAIQFSRGQHTTYDAAEVMSDPVRGHGKYKNDPMEREVKDVLEEAARELKLGSEYGRKMGNPSTGRIVG